MAATTATRTEAVAIVSARDHVRFLCARGRTLRYRYFQHIQPPAAGADRVVQLVQVGEIRDVTRYCGGRLRADGIDGRVQLDPTPTEDENVRAFGRQSCGRRQADADAAPGDNGDFPSSCPM